MLTAMLIAAMVAVLIAKVLPALDTLCAWLLAGFVVYLAATRNGGFDYIEYAIIIDSVRALKGESLFSQIIAAKDPFFAIIIYLAEWFSPRIEVVFFLTAAISMATKVYATTFLHQNRTLFIALYSIFIAPGFEFAAIRAGLGVGFVMISIASINRYRIIWVLIAILNHLSLAIILPARFLQPGFTKRNFLLLCGTALIVLTTLDFIQRVEILSYRITVNNYGTFRAFSLPIVTIINLIFLEVINRSPLAVVDRRSSEAFTMSLVCTVISLLLALPAVTYSYRILEVGWVFMIINQVSSKNIPNILKVNKYVAHGNKLRHSNMDHFNYVHYKTNRVKTLFTWGVTIALLSFINVYRDTWLILL